MDDEVSALIGIAPPVVTSVSGMDYTFPNTMVSASRSSSSRGRPTRSVRSRACEATQSQEPKKLVVIDSATHLFEGRRAKLVRRSRLLADF